jgi:hypothetical protein
MKAWWRFRSRLKFASVATLALVVLGSLGFEGSLIYTRHRALRFLHEVKKLKLGESSTADVEVLLHDYGGWSKKVSDSSCSEPDCFIYCVQVYDKPMEYVFRARWAILNLRRSLTHLEWIPKFWRVFAMLAQVKNGRVVRIEVVLLFRKRDESCIEGETILVQNGREGPEWLALRKGYIPHRFVMTGGDGGEGIEAIIDSRASPEDRERAFDFNLRCISTLSGCSELRELMPSVWSDYQKFLRQHTAPAAP